MANAKKRGVASTLLAVAMTGFASASQLDPTANLRSIHEEMELEEELWRERSDLDTNTPEARTVTGFTYRPEKPKDLGLMGEATWKSIEESYANASQPAHAESNADDIPNAEEHRTAIYHNFQLEDQYPQSGIWSPEMFADHFKRVNSEIHTAAIENAVRYHGGVPTDSISPSVSQNTWASYNGQIWALDDSALGGTGYLVNGYRNVLFGERDCFVDLVNTTPRYGFDSDLLQTFDFQRANAFEHDLPPVISSSDSLMRNLDTLGGATADVLQVMAAQVRETVGLPQAEADKFYNAVVSRIDDLEFFVRSEVQALQSSLHGLESRMSYSERALLENGTTVAKRVDLRKTLTEMPQRMVNRAADVGAMKLAVEMGKGLAKVVTSLCAGA